MLAEVLIVSGIQLPGMVEMYYTADSRTKAMTV